MFADWALGGGEEAFPTRVPRRSRMERLADQGSGAAVRVRELQDHMDQFLATVQIGVTVCGTLAGVLGGVLAARYLEPVLSGGMLARVLPHALIASVAVGLGIVYVELILGELVGLYGAPEAGPFFFEIIERKCDDMGFGAGNFRALFESIERDQAEGEGRR